MVAAPTFACLTPLAFPVPAPLASSWSEMSRRVILLQRPTYFSLAVLPSVVSHWTPVTIQMCTSLFLSWTTSFLWTMTVWMARFTTQMFFLMSSGRCQWSARPVPRSPSCVCSVPVSCVECARKLGKPWDAVNTPLFMPCLWPAASCGMLKVSLTGWRLWGEKRFGR